MTAEREGLAGGVLLILIGVFVVARTVIHDNNGQNLVDRLLTIAGGGSSSTSSTSSPGVSVTTKGTGVSVKHLGPVPVVQVHTPHLKLFGVPVPNPFDQANTIENVLGAK